MLTTTVSFLLFGFFLPAALADLSVGFYAATCPNAETIVRDVVTARFKTDPSIAPALLRLQFHDCFVHGCDASLLIDPKPDRPSEKNSTSNLSVRGYDVIDDIKKQLEAACPRNVSCSDIISLGTRDAVVLAGGPSYTVRTGRRDGTVSDPNDVNLPSPTMAVPDAIKAFSLINMDADDLVVLLGAHTIGFTHCSFVRDRIGDSSMSKSLASNLRNTCSKPNDPAVALDQGTPFFMDNEFYKQTRMNNAILKLDQSIASHSDTSGFVADYAVDANLFARRFAAAMVKLGETNVLTGNAGEIRTNCRDFNPSKEGTGKPVTGKPIIPGI